MSSHPVESLSALLDEELDDAERRVVEAHLAGCPSCARHLRELAAVDALARGLPPAGAPDGYLEALPGRVRQRIRADRPPASRPSWVWPLAAGLALAVLAPIVLRQSLSRPRVSSSSPTAVREAPVAPATTVAPPPSKMSKIDDATRPPAAYRAPQRETAPEPKTRDAFVAPPPAARANESDRGEPAASVAVAQEAAGAAPAADAVRERMDAPASLKKAEALGAAATPQEARGRIDSGVEEKTFRDNASLPAATPEEARAAREAWRRFVALHPTGPRADEGRVRFIEAAAALFGLTGDEGDRAIAEREGRAYLAVPGAPQASRVRDALRRLER